MNRRDGRQARVGALLARIRPRRLIRRVRPHSSLRRIRRRSAPLAIHRHSLPWCIRRHSLSWCVRPHSQLRGIRQYSPLRREEQHRPVAGHRRLHLSLVNGSMMPPAEQQRVLQARFTPVGPVFHVMGFGESAAAARKSAPAVSFIQRPPDVRRNRARSAAHIHPVIVHEGRERAPLMPDLLRLQLSLAGQPSPHAHHPLQLCRGTGARKREQLRLALRRGHAGKRPHLGVGDAASPQSVGGLRQVFQRSGGPYPLARAGS